MPNPALLLCDSDALVQFFIVDDLRPLQELARYFGIQPVVTIEVDMELRWLARHRDRFVSQLDKALKHGTLLKLGQAEFQKHLSVATPGTSWATFQNLGAKYYGFVQRGEAYTHAAAVALTMPALSNDQKAVFVLKSQMCQTAVPTIRTFDLLVFAKQAGILSVKDCDDIRSELLKNGEGIPGPFLHASFEDGMKLFPCRLREAQEQPGSDPVEHHDPLTIVRL
jgi:hypothetical protein